MPEIDAHPVRGIDGSAVFHSNPSRCRGGLQFVRKGIIVAPLPVVQETARRGQEIERRFHVPAGLGRPNIFGSCPRSFSLHLGNQSHPPRHVVIAQTAGRILEIRLQMKDRVALFFVPLPCQFGKVGKQIGQRCVDHSGKGRIAQPFKDLAIAPKIAAIEYGNIELRIVPLKFFALAEKTMRRADAKPQVP